jgi:cytochrome c556
MRFLTPLAASAALVAASGLVLAHGKHGHGKAIDYRTSVMTVFTWNLRPMGAMAKGKTPYDKALFARHARDLNAAAHLDLLPGFPDGSDEGDTEARPDIWLDWDGFTEKYAALKQATEALAAAAGGDLTSSVKDKLGKVGDACKSCHRAYRER